MLSPPHAEVTFAKPGSQQGWNHSSEFGPAGTSEGQMDRRVAPGHDPQTVYCLSATKKRQSGSLREGQMEEVL